MVIFYLLTNMSSPHYFLCPVGTKIFFAKFYFWFMNNSNHCEEEIMFRTREQGKHNTDLDLLYAGEPELLDAERATKRRARSSWRWRARTAWRGRPPCFYKFGENRRTAELKIVYISIIDLIS